MVFNLLIVSSSETDQSLACALLQRRLNQDENGRFKVTLLVGLERAVCSVDGQIDGQKYDCVIVDGFYSERHGYGAGSLAAPLIDELVNQGIPFGRFIGRSIPIPAPYGGLFVLSKPLQANFRELILSAMAN